MISDLEALLARVEGAEALLRELTDVAPSLPDLYRWTDLKRVEGLFDAEHRHGSGPPHKYLMSWLSMLRPFAFASKDDSWGEMEKLLCIVMRNYVRVAATADRARALIAQQTSLDPARTDVPSGKGEP